MGHVCGISNEQSIVVHKNALKAHTNSSVALYFYSKEIS